MYLRKKTVKRGDKVYEYAQLVESRRVNGEPRQRVLATLGRIEREHGKAKALQAADALLRFFERNYGTELIRTAEQRIVEEDGWHAREFGSIAVIEEAWRSLGLDKILKRLAQGRRFEFSLERAVFGMVAQRLIKPGSKLQCVDWLKNDVHLPSAGALDEDDLYAALTWLEEVESKVEERLFKGLQRSGRLEPTVVFYDTTTTWFEGRGPEDLAQFGRPKGGQPLYRRLILVGLVRSQEGWPITHRVFPGNTADISTVRGILLDLKGRFGIKRCVFVADRGMISKEVLELLENLDLEYVLATRMRSTKEVRDCVLGRAGRFRKVRDNLEVKEVTIEDRRYVVCRNPASVERDRLRRDDILATLRKKLAECDRAQTEHGQELLRHKSYRRYLRVQAGRLVIAKGKVKQDGRYDGKWVLRTNLDEATAAELALTYKAQGRIERDFRDLKSFIEIRPVYHRLEPRVRAHAFICVLALAVRNELERRLQTSGSSFSLKKALAQLSRVQAFPVRPEPGVTFWQRCPVTHEQRAVLDEFGVTDARLTHLLR